MKVYNGRVGRFFAHAQPGLTPATIRLADALDRIGIPASLSHDSGKIVLRLDIIEADALTAALRGHDNHSKEE